MKIKKYSIIIVVILLIFTILTQIQRKNTMEEKIGIKKEDKVMKVIINNIEYNIYFEDNETSKEFINLMPIDLKMNELNGNEKYVYLDKKLPSNPTNVKKINAGDIMLYQDNCLVIFYKSFDTTYAYTKIGHIDKLPQLNTDSISVKFKK